MENKADIIEQFLNGVKNPAYNLYEISEEEAVRDAVERKTKSYTKYYKNIKAIILPPITINNETHYPILFKHKSGAFSRVAYLKGKKKAASVAFQKATIDEIRLLQSKLAELKKNGSQKK